MLPTGRLAGPPDVTLTGGQGFPVFFQQVRALILKL
jgi:hypothetical protein